MFDILWEFLKETPRRNDRLPFLNSLQLLVKGTKNPIQALKVLLSDFAMDPAGVEYFDRNAIMLANQFLRTYNKEINMDIEITPEEVLLVIEGLDPSVVNYASWKLDGEQKSFFGKFITIRKRLIDSLDVDSPGYPLPADTLFTGTGKRNSHLPLSGGRIVCLHGRPRCIECIWQSGIPGLPVKGKPGSHDRPAAASGGADPRFWPSGHTKRSGTVK